jgi:hypothetical protein
MKTDLAQQSTVGSNPADQQRLAATTSASYWFALRTADHACCCPAKPEIVAVMPPAPGRDHPTDLLLCAHHYRASSVALHAAGAAVFDGAGPGGRGG